MSSIAPTESSLTQNKHGSASNKPANVSKVTRGRRKAKPTSTEELAPTATATATTTETETHQPPPSDPIINNQNLDQNQSTVRTGENNDTGENTVRTGETTTGTGGNTGGTRNETTGETINPETVYGTTGREDSDDDEDDDPRNNNNDSFLEAESGGDSEDERERDVEFVVGKAPNVRRMFNKHQVITQMKMNISKTT